MKWAWFIFWHKPLQTNTYLGYTMRTLSSKWACGCVQNEIQHPNSSKKKKTHHFGITDKNFHVLFFNRKHTFTCVLGDFKWFFFAKVYLSLDFMKKMGDCCNMYATSTASTRQKSLQLIRCCWHPLGGLPQPSHIFSSILEAHPCCWAIAATL